MANPYKTSTVTSASVESSVPTRSPALYLFALYGGGGICWLALFRGFQLTFKDMFGGPAPPETAYFFVAAGFFGVVAELAGVIYVVWRRTFGASIGAIVFAGLTMAATALPLLVLGEVLLKELAR